MDYAQMARLRKTEALVAKLVELDALDGAHLGLVAIADKVDLLNGSTKPEARSALDAIARAAGVVTPNGHVPSADTWSLVVFTLRQRAAAASLTEADLFKDL